MRRRLLLALTTLGLALPNIALACPACAGRDDGGIGRVVALGVMIAFPFAVVGLVTKMIKAVSRPQA
ncbi:MAG: hypothetical protein AAF533_25270 [Acidobacteriota bacterium]